MTKEKKNKNEKKDFKIILPYLKQYKIILIILSLFTFLISLKYIFTGYLNGAAIESVIKTDLKAAILYLILYFLIESIGGGIEQINSYFFSKIQIKIAHKIGYDTYQKVMKLPAYAFEELSSGEIINRITSDTETVIGSIQRLINTAAHIISSLVILIYIFINSWIIGLEITTFLLIYIFIVKHYTNLIKDYNKKSKEQNDKYTAIANESVKGIREIKTLGIITNLKNSIAEIIKKLYHISTQEYKTYAKYDIVSILLKNTLEVGTFITCAILVYHGHITITFFVAMTYYIYRYTWLIENVTEFSKIYEKLSVSLNRINEILGNKLYQDVTYGNHELKDPQGVIEFKDVTFNYKNEDIILNNFNIKFEPNKKIAIIGSSGEGKSTIFNLITRIFDPIKGSICLDNVNIQELTETSLRENISIIRQEPFLFNRTILENFQLVNPKVSLEEIRNYCKLACIDEYIMSLPNQYDTILGEGGVNLSGGQKQRLSIARTLMKKSKVILFDEATSALDNESQEYIKKSIDQLVKDHTILIVAHRLSTIIDADLIYIIRKGKVYAQGTHQELIKNCEYYQKLYQSEDQIK